MSNWSDTLSWQLFSPVKTVITVDKQRKHIKYTLISLPLNMVERLDDVVRSYR